MEFDYKYHSYVILEFEKIKTLSQNKPVSPVEISELRKAISSLNKGKSSDVYGLTAENVAYGREEHELLLLRIVNSIFENGTIPMNY